MELAKPDLLPLLDHYEADTSRLSEVGWSRRKIKCVNPAHDDHSPSMTVNLEEGKVKCWSCGFSGDGYDIIQAREGISDFNEAKRFAADHFGTANREVRRTPSRYVPSWAESDDD